MINKNKLRILSLGAGVQSSTLALMIEKGEIEPIDFAVFADTMQETQDTYDHLKFLQDTCSFEIKIVSEGDLLEDTFNKFIHIPFHTKNKSDGKGGLITRQCTNHYKIRPVYQEIRKALGLQKGELNKTGIIVEQIMGISLDEMQRMTINKTKWINNVYPLVEKKIRRSDCIEWLKMNDFPIPPRSACWFCPYNSKSRWLDLKYNYPEYFEKAIQLDKKIRNFKGRTNSIKEDVELYLTSRKKPLDEVDFEKKDNNQIDFSFVDECSGMCGN